MTRPQLEAMRDAAKERHEEFERKAKEWHSRRQFDTANSLGVSAMVAMVLVEMCNAALKVTP